MKKITAFDIAEYYIYRSSEDQNHKLSHKKLQKLVYYAQAWTLALTGRPLFSDKIEAWIHGPAISALYGKYKHFGFDPIEPEKQGYDFNWLPDKTILDEVWRIYGKYDGDYLEILTHQEEPWITARNRLEFDKASNNEITIQSMKSYYTQKLKDSKINERKISKNP